MSNRSPGVRGGLGAVLLVLGLIGGACQAPGPSVEEAIAKACEEQNRGCPKMVESGVRLDSVTAGENKLMLFRYTLTDTSADQMDVDKFKKIMEEELNAGAKADRSIQFLLKAGATVQYSYQDKDGLLLGDFVLKE